MKHGDISNSRSLCIGFRCENTLLHPKLGVSNLVQNVVKNKWINADVDKRVLAIMKDIYWNTEYTIALVMDSELSKNTKFMDYIDDFPISMVMNTISSLSEITMWLNTGDLSYFVTDDILEKSKINSRFVLSVDDFSKIYSKGRIKR